MGKDAEWREIVRAIEECRACPLHRFRRNPVPGEGSLNAQVLFLGEAPGRREDETGRPFVGAAGKLLDELLEEIGLRRGDVFITNVVKCRPPNNRDPKPVEVEACSIHTLRILRLISPAVVVTLGNHSGRFVYEELMGRSWRGVTRERGRVHDLLLEGRKVKVLSTYHPAAALYNPKLKDRLEEDFSTIRKLLNELSPPRQNINGKRVTILDYIRGSARNEER